ncbi:MAG: hypothetical protein ACRCTQ_00765 [Brevinemataceae bacterium]
MNFKSSSKSLKYFVKIFETRMPNKLKIVAELRLMWKDIVGATLASRSCVDRCEFVSYKDESGNPTGAYYRRLIILADETAKIALTDYSDKYLEKIPKKYQIHSLRIQQATYQKLKIWEHSPKKELPKNNISDSEKHQIDQKVDKVLSGSDLKKTLQEFLYLCRGCRNQKDS